MACQRHLALGTTFRDRVPPLTLRLISQMAQDCARRGYRSCPQAWHVRLLGQSGEDGEKLP